jgi:transposase
MVRERRGHNLEAWMAEATDSGIDALARFARGLEGALAAVTAGLSLNWSNGVTEGLMHRLTWLTRQSTRVMDRRRALTRRMLLVEGSSMTHQK